MSETPNPSHEADLLAEIERLRRQLAESHQTPAPPPQLWKPSGITIAALALGVVVVFFIAFLAGYGPWQKRNLTIMAESRQETRALPRVEVVRVVRSPSNTDLKLPGNIQAITEAPILARVDGYILRRLVDIGDQVKNGQTLAEIDVPEIDEQVRQAKATLDQAHASVDEAQANLEQGQSDLALAKISSDRWNALVGRGAVSKQENDQYQTQYQSKVAGVRALEKAVVAQRNAVGAAEANLARLQKMRDYRLVTAPFDGVITMRNVDIGALVNAGSTLLYRIAQTGRLRIFLNVPQSDSSAVHPGQRAAISVSNLPGRDFLGEVVRTANALDPATRTLLTEVQLANPAGVLQPGMYADVNLASRRPDPPMVIPSSALLMRDNGAQAAFVGPDNVVHFKRIQVERDYGDRLDVTSGLDVGDVVVVNPTDAIVEGRKVDPVAARPKS
ncbi:MAG: efflux RND transporter periplasmic adaptor subunit [Acidobacteriota bacterium]|nr:efflux RND transporter periplasmic adaptor subunit [Acidobacteriota bacterium]